jgi:hypothetical protein
MPKVVVQATVKKSAVIAYFEGKEQKIIVVPKLDDDLTDVRVLEGNLHKGVLGGFIK